MMQSFIFKKFNKYLIYPDLANKFLHASLEHLRKETESFKIYLKYIFTNNEPFSYFGLKAIMMMSSVYPKRCWYTSRMIIVKFSKARCHSIVYMTLVFNEYAELMSYYSRSPTTINMILNSHLKESKYFTFPGFIKHLKLPSWDRKVNMVIEARSSQATFLFRKIIFID